MEKQIFLRRNSGGSILLDEVKPIKAKQLTWQLTSGATSTGMYIPNENETEFAMNSVIPGISACTPVLQRSYYHGNTVYLSMELRTLGAGKIYLCALIIFNCNQSLKNTADIHMDIDVK